jgi:Uma2 family endonuclease
MATGMSRRTSSARGYPTSDGKPMAETDDHRDLMVELIETLKLHYQAAPRVYVSGNLLVYYVPGDKRRHVSPDVFVVRGVAKHNRDNYLVWEERKGPEVVIELTSSSTRKEDQERKFRLYRDQLQVREYFLFDPHGDYLQPSPQGYRLRQGQYMPIKPVAGRLPSKVLNLHLEGSGTKLRLYNPATRQWLPTPQEVREQAELAHRQEAAARRQAELAHRQEAAAHQQAEEARQQAESARQQEAAARQQAEEAHQQEATARRQVEAENARLQQELQALRRRLSREP